MGVYLLVLDFLVVWYSLYGVFLLCIVLKYFVGGICGIDLYIG